MRYTINHVLLKSKENYYSFTNKYTYLSIAKHLYIEKIAPKLYLRDKNVELITTLWNLKQNKAKRKKILGLTI